jgi:hypothetical protein
MKTTNKAKTKRLVVTVSLTPDQNALLDALVARRERERQPTERPLSRAEVALLCLTVGVDQLTPKETTWDQPERATSGKTKNKMKVLETTTTDIQTAKLEASLRRKARSSGLLLRKCRVRDQQHPAFGTYGLVDANNHLVLGDGSTGYGIPLEAVAAYLNETSLKKG